MRGLTINLTCEYNNELVAFMLNYHCDNNNKKMTLHFIIHSFQHRHIAVVHSTVCLYILNLDCMGPLILVHD